VEMTETPIRHPTRWPAALTENIGGALPARDHFGGIDAAQTYPDNAQIIGRKTRAAGTCFMSPVAARWH
jgi:hypothetical protein